MHTYFSTSPPNQLKRLIAHCHNFGKEGPQTTTPMSCFLLLVSRPLVSRSIDRRRFRPLLCFCGGCRFAFLPVSRFDAFANACCCFHSARRAWSVVPCLLVASPLAGAPASSLASWATPLGPCNGSPRRERRRGFATTQRESLGRRASRRTSLWNGLAAPSVFLGDVGSVASICPGIALPRSVRHCLSCSQLQPWGTDRASLINALFEMKLPPLNNFKGNLVVSTY